MALESYFGIPRASARPADNDNEDAYFVAEWGEGVAVTVAVSAAVAIVVLIAVLMGSVGP